MATRRSNLIPIQEERRRRRNQNCKISKILSINQQKNWVTAWASWRAAWPWLILRSKARPKASWAIMAQSWSPTITSMIKQTPESTRWWRRKACKNIPRRRQQEPKRPRVATRTSPASAGRARVSNSSFRRRIRRKLATIKFQWPW